MKLFLHLFAAISVIYSSFVFAETLSVPNVKKEVTEVLKMSKPAVNESLNHTKQAVGLTKDSAKKSVLEKAAIIKKDITQKVTTSETPTKKMPKVNVNKADIATLQTLNGIGEVKAKAIIDYRNKKGKIKNINELSKVSGIGESTLEKLKGLVSF
ncbi:hypothetical protein A6B43_05115 [Vespertiliibacter pulmonis]|uniref:ComEA protein n=1 Tax=Vespertiliibacter pulmonis TaxID=1443036 RepID=A0A3N4VKG8_9PAST|nr:ComEA family DNA-binding protein [Vespertiliibacter pulmonis]QLB20948.1 hypothetical protein A6B43_05115 [Vespertiliibacter pulmonis]RPE83606.1 comEA protein [Vespertiliibacter pulmonis]